MSYTPSLKIFGKSWCAGKDINGALIPHGESYTIREFLSDKETG